MTAKPKNVSTERRLAEALTVIRKLEADVENLKAFGLNVSARVLRLELAVSSLDKNDELRSILYPETESF